MTWTVSIAPSAKQELKRLDPQIQRLIVKFVDKITSSADPKELMEPYSGMLAGYWKKRLGDYRLVCDIRESELVVLIIKVGHRSKVYRG